MNNYEDKTDDTWELRDYGYAKVVWYNSCDEVVRDAEGNRIR